MNYLVVGAGGVIGAILRYIVGKIFREVMDRDHPVATLFINMIGSFLIGYLSTKHLSSEYKLFLMTGLLGGFTTYSTFMFETSRYIKKEKHIKAIIYIFVSIISGITAACVGIWLASFV
ncbi:fluoride efflux transporter CrcB [Anaerocellum diazotrophicum]|uniref:Fluoride-specific ion channel FluC n=1 Tax=Caldicellulosiruptor diazotrophicus TaxID=2806205 RepID=A0ABM7NP92_9FIRM|nr:fluoride efflux transporter CrcB [Caldicellulosiruptor diazotrophicus]BCS81908.1 putative fluoride ion transporter CrcB [Caldicellulosiruptor diazotrophicus]